jgi:hypothetical protein
MRTSLLVVVLASLLCTACAHLPTPGSDFGRAVDAALSRGEEELLTTGRCVTRFAVTCEASSRLVTMLSFSRTNTEFFDRDGRKMGERDAGCVGGVTRGDAPPCRGERRAEELCERSRARVRRVAVTVRLGPDAPGIDVRPGHTLSLGAVEGTVGFGARGAVMFTLRRVPEGISVLAGEAPRGAPMREVYERATLELPVRLATVIDGEWQEFTVDVVHETYERVTDVPLAPLAHFEKP